MKDRKYFISYITYSMPLVWNLNTISFQPLILQARIRNSEDLVICLNLGQNADLLSLKAVDL